MDLLENECLLGLSPSPVSSLTPPDSPSNLNGDPAIIPVLTGFTPPTPGLRRTTYSYNGTPQSRRFSLPGNSSYCQVARPADSCPVNNTIRTAVTPGPSSTSSSGSNSSSGMWPLLPKTLPTHQAFLPGRIHSVAPSMLSLSPPEQQFTSCCFEGNSSCKSPWSSIRIQDYILTEHEIDLTATLDDIILPINVRHAVHGTREPEVTAQLPHKCPDCSLRFKWPSSLKRHSYTHLPSAVRTKQRRADEADAKSKVLLYYCTYCPRSFRSVGLRNKHARMHTAKFVCIACNAAYVEKVSLLRHQRKVHGGLL